MYILDTFWMEIMVTWINIEMKDQKKWTFRTLKTYFL